MDKIQNGFVTNYKNYEATFNTAGQNDLIIEVNGKKFKIGYYKRWWSKNSYRFYSANQLTGNDFYSIESIVEEALKKSGVTL